jgi:hypothetical protein
LNLTRKQKLFSGLTCHKCKKSLNVELLAFMFLSV